MSRRLRSWAVEAGYFLLRSGWRLPRSWQRVLEDFFERDRLAYAMLRNQVDLVIDVGAENGSFVHNLRRMGFLGWVVSFEPSPEVFRQLERRLVGDSRWKGYPYALGSGEMRRQFHVAKLGNLSSFLKPREAEVMETREVEVRRLDTLWPEILRCTGAKHVFLKVDTQGFDLEVVSGAEGCLGKVDLFQSEISIEPLYQGSPHYIETLAAYEKLGFQLIEVFPVLRDRKRRNVLEYDCLMERRK